MLEKLSKIIAILNENSIMAITGGNLTFSPVNTNFKIKGIDYE